MLEFIASYLGVSLASVEVTTGILIFLVSAYVYREEDMFFT